METKIQAIYDEVKQTQCLSYAQIEAIKMILLNCGEAELDVLNQLTDLLLSGSVELSKK